MQKQVVLPGVANIEENFSVPASHSLRGAATENDAKEKESIPRSAAAAEVRKVAFDIFIQFKALEERHALERMQCFDDWLQQWDSPRVLPDNLTPSVQHASVWQSNRLDDTPDSPTSDRPKESTEHLKQSDEYSIELSPETISEVESPEQAILRGKPKANIRHKKKKRKNQKGFLVTPSAAMELERTRLQRFTSSRMYEAGSAVLIFMNTFIIGWNIQWTAEHSRATQQHARSRFFDVFEALFTISFAIELALRWVADGFWDFFTSEDYGWCIFDVVIVSWSVIDLFVHVIMSDHDDNLLMSEITLLRMLRIMRIVRILRVIRVMHIFRELRMMIYSLMTSLMSLLWVLIVLNFVFFIFGVVLTTGAVATLTEQKSWEDPDHQVLAQSFGTLDRSMLTLFMSMSGGNDWSMYFEALAPCDWQFRFFFLNFIMLAIFAVVNIVTGVFVQSAMEANKHDRQAVIHEEIESKKEYCKAMRQFFEEIDEDSTGTMGYEEFHDKLDDERVVAYFNALKLDVSDARMLFRLIDFDNSGEIEIDEFLLGCYTLQGESRKLDMKVMQLELRWLREAFSNFVHQFPPTRHSIQQSMTKFVRQQS